MENDLNEKKNNVYFITGGGTGGHIYPALAVIDELKKNNIENIYYVGNKKNLEYKLATEKNIKFLPVNISGMPRKFSLGIIFWAIKLFFAIITSVFYVLKYKPHLVFGTGGYVSAPILFASKILKIPYALHDADAQPGIVTRCFSSRAKVLTTPFESIKTLLPCANIKVTGNPIREEFATISKEEAKKELNLSDKLTLLIMGGSQGARSVNYAIIPILKKIIEEFDINILHQTGKKNYDDSIDMLKKHFPEYENCDNYKLLPYIDNMPLYLKSADIVISRSGSLSLSEIKASGSASILIPYPFSAGDHQKKNAQAMVDEGCSFMIEDNDLNYEALYEVLKMLFTNNEKLNKMKENSALKAKYNATKEIVKNLLEI